MGLLTEEIEVSLGAANISHYENRGYKIPRIKNTSGKMIVPKNATITVKTDDLPHGSHVKIDLECDCCKKHMVRKYKEYYELNHNGKYYCCKCANAVFNSGENNPCWNSNKTEAEREIGRKYSGYKRFIKKVLARDDYVCQCCNKKIKHDAEVHHLNGYNWFIEGRLDETNAVTLCSNCHGNFHSIYGRGNNTKEQYEEWIGHAIGELEKYNRELPIARKIYCIEENKIYDNAQELQKEWGYKSHYCIYNACNTYKQVNNKHIFWLDEYECMNQDCLQKILETKIKFKKPSKVLNRKIICITTNEIFNNYIEAETKYKANCILKCCNNKIKTSGKLPDGRRLQWMYYDEYLSKINNGEEIVAINKIIRKSKKIICLTMNEIFDNSKIASEKYNIKWHHKILECCRGQLRTCGKLPDGTPLKWMYYEDFLKLSQEEQKEILERNKDSSVDGSFNMQKIN